MLLKFLVVCISWNGFLNDGLKCGHLNGATDVDLLEPSLWVVLMYAQKKEGRFQDDVGTGYLSTRPWKDEMCGQ